MGQTVKSARGTTVDFDLLKIKQQIAAAPKTTEVKTRESFIDQKFRRRLKKLTKDAKTQVAERETPVEPEATTTPDEELE
jgi:DNA polymerase sigma